MLRITNHRLERSTGEEMARGERWEGSKGVHRAFPSPQSPQALMKKRGKPSLWTIKPKEQYSIRREIRRLFSI